MPGHSAHLGAPRHARRSPRRPARARRPCQDARSCPAATIMSGRAIGARRRGLSMRRRRSLARWARLGFICVPPREPRVVSSVVPARSPRSSSPRGFFHSAGGRGAETLRHSCLLLPAGHAAFTLETHDTIDSECCSCRFTSYCVHAHQYNISSSRSNLRPNDQQPNHMHTCILSRYLPSSPRVR